MERGRQVVKKQNRILPECLFKLPNAAEFEKRRVGGKKNEQYNIACRTIKVSVYAYNDIISFLPIWLSYIIIL